MPALALTLVPPALVQPPLIPRWRRRAGPGLTVGRQKRTRYVFMALRGLGSDPSDVLEIETRAVDFDGLGDHQLSSGF